MSDFAEYRYGEIEKKWQEKWDKLKSFELKAEKNEDVDVYVLEMFPYPSGNIHMGHLRNYVIGDVIARWQMFSGKKVLHPIGWDSFGLPAENAAIERNVCPDEWTMKNIAAMREQLKMIGLSYDWSREIVTCASDYYKHEQKMFLEFYKNGIAYKKKSEVNWDPVDETVLANEQVIDGKGWRSGAVVEKRDLSQWALRVSDFSSELLEGLKDLKDWPEKVKLMQSKWIGESSGAYIIFLIENYRRHYLIESEVGVEKCEKFKSCEGLVFDVVETDAPKENDAFLGRVLSLKCFDSDEEYEFGYVNCELCKGNKFAGDEIVMRVLLDDDVDFDQIPKGVVSVVDGVFSCLEWFTDLCLEVRSGFKNCYDVASSVSVFVENEALRNALLDVGFELSDSLNCRLSLNLDEFFGLLGKCVRVFTTRAETLFGASFVGLAMDHSLVGKLMKRDKNIEESILKYRSDSEGNKGAEDDKMDKEKIGIDLGVLVINPANGEEMRLFAVNYVISGHGTGAVFGCPAHDERDFDFAKKYKLPIACVVSGGMEGDDVYTGTDGVMVNSGFLNEMEVLKARDEMIKFLTEKRVGNFAKVYKLRDWGVSRQRYWGCPIPIIYCKKCGTIPEAEANLPVELPKDVKISLGSGNPLERHPSWKNTSCHRCGGEAVRETDTFDTFFESSWYFLRYCSLNKRDSMPFEFSKRVDYYVGGVEHAILHLLYSRFFVKALKVCGYDISYDEPFSSLVTQGMVCHKTFKNKSTGKWLTPVEARGLASDEVEVGASIKMSKSKKNVIEPEAIIKKYGVDTARFFMMSDTPPERDMEWSDDGIEATSKFLKKFWNYACSIKDVQFQVSRSDKNLTLVHSTLHEYYLDIKAIALNKAVAKIRVLCNAMFKESDNLEARYILNYVVKMMFLFTPHLAEEVWEQLGNESSLAMSLSDKADEKYFRSSKCKIAVQVNGKMKFVLEADIGVGGDEFEKIYESEIAKLTDGKKVIKKIFVPNKILNIVVGN